MLNISLSSVSVSNLIASLSGLEGKVFLSKFSDGGASIGSNFLESPHLRFCAFVFLLQFKRIIEVKLK